MKRKSKRTFLLLELILALAILALCALPLIENPLMLFRAERKSFELSELQRQADRKFADIKEKFYKKQDITWKDFSYESQPPSPRFSEKIKLPSKGRPYQEDVYLWTLNEIKNKNGEDYHLISVKIIYTPLQLKKPREKYRFEYRVHLVNKPNEVIPS